MHFQSVRTAAFGILTVSIALGASACNNIDGWLTVNSPITMKDKKGALVTVSSSRKINVDPENVGEIGKEELKLKFKDDAGKERKIVMKVPASQRLPEYSGSIFLRGSDVGQSFDLNAAIDTQESDGPQSQTTRSCTYTDREWVCHPSNDPNHPYPECGYEDVTRTGSQQVIQHTHYTVITGNAEFYEAGSSKLLATFNGTRRETQTITDWEGPCYANWGNGW